MNVIEVEGFNFLEVSQSPNIIISLKGERNFSAVDIKTKKGLLKKYFGVLSYQEFNQTHSTNILGIDAKENNEFDGFLSNESKAAFAIKTADCIPLLLWDEEKKINEWFALWLERYKDFHERLRAIRSFLFLFFSFDHFGNSST